LEHVVDRAADLQILPLLARVEVEQSARAAVEQELA